MIHEPNIRIQARCNSDFLARGRLRIHFFPHSGQVKRRSVFLVVLDVMLREAIGRREYRP